MSEKRFGNPEAPEQGRGPEIRKDDPPRRPPIEKIGETAVKGAQNKR